MPSDWPQNAHPVTRVIGSEGTAALTFEVPAGVVLRVESVYAEFDTSGGAAAPMLTVTDDSGAVIARKRQSETADDPALSSATWALRLSDESVVTSGSGPGALVKRAAPAASQAINPNANTPISFNASDWASPGMVNLGAQPTRITITLDGIYHVAGAIQWTTLAGDVDVRHTFVQPNPIIGTLTPQQCAIYKQDALNFFVAVADTIPLTAGRFLTLTTVHRAAAARNCFGSLSCQWLGPII